MLEIRLLLLLAVSTPIIQSARILAVIPTVSKSHYASSKNILLALGKRHEMVVISPHEEKDPPGNWTWVPMKIKSFSEAIPNIDNSAIRERTFFEGQKNLWVSMNTYTDYVTNLTEVKNFIINDRSHFDLVIAEEFFSAAFYGFAYKYRAPLVLISSFGPAHFISEYLGNSLEMTTVPHEFSFIYGEMSFFERAKNLVYTVYDLFGRKYFNLDHQDGISKRLFGVETPHVGELEREASLVLINSHFSTHMVQPNLPNMIEIAGVHIDEPKPLEQELKAILDNAPHGVVLFSFGSIVEVALLPKKEVVVPILKALGRLKQEVLLKWNSEDAPPMTFKNIHTFKWLPQNDILAHPNLVAFVTHGGLMSSQEALHHGVPSICVPFFGDQPINCQRSVKLGFGIHLRIQDLSEDVLFDSLESIITDMKFRENVRDLSRRFKDRPMSAIDTAVFWIEYVIRHQGAGFMKGPKRNLRWFQVLYLDAVVLFVVAFLVVRKVVRNIYCVVFRKKVKTN